MIFKEESPQQEIEGIIELLEAAYNHSQSACDPVEWHVRQKNLLLVVTKIITSDYKKRLDNMKYLNLIQETDSD